MELIILKWLVKMFAVLQILRIHIMKEIMRRLSSIEIFIRSQMSNNMEMQNLEEI